MKKYTREKLIQLCEESVVHHTKWHDRDSFSTQMMIQSIYEGLTAGFDFEIDCDSNNRTIWINFINIDTDMLKDAKYLSISERDEYFTECDPDYDTEMFVGYGIDFYSSYTSGYMPTRKRLDEVNGGDWY